MFEQVATVAAAMEGYDGLWFISGGWAIDLFGGRVTREHSDLEVGIVRHDQASLQAHPAAWELSKAVRQLLDEGRRVWLRVALETYQPTDPWIAALA